MRFAPDIYALNDTSSDSGLTDAPLPKDDVDVLFDKLQILEPPESLIARILELPKNSPMLPLLATPTLRNPWEDFDSLALHNGKEHPLA
ncbi:MAG TPA: hypothetical protein VKV20_00090 [Ktedonobacteraceae bacterium]|jgi:hypothetical protein|nr:hypothetical protein [Ktedonobacteraceae bacterium]